MELVKLVVWGFIIYLAYKFIFGLLLPVSKAASQIKDNMRKMQENQQQQSRPPEENTQAKSETPPVTGGEYIDYEEIK